MHTLQVATAASVVGLQIVATLEAVAVAVAAVAVAVGVTLAVAVVLTAISIPIMMMRKMISKIFLTVWKTLRFQTSIKFKC